MPSEALYGYLIPERTWTAPISPLSRLPTGIQVIGRTAPDVPFEMLTALPLRKEHWTDLARG